MHRHSKVCIAPETHFIRRFILKRTRDVPGVTDPPYNWGQYVDGFFQLPEVQEMGLKKPDSLEELQRLQAGDPSELFRWALETFRKSQKAEIVGEKTPNHLLYIPELKSMFPNCGFIAITRDPRAVVASWKKVPWSTGCAAGDARVWDRYQRHLNDHLQIFKNSIFNISFEKLVADPARVLRSICEWLDIPFEDKMLSSTEIQSAVNVEREPWKHRVGDDFNKGRIESWKTSLSQSEISKIEAICEAGMVRQGYLLNSNAKSRRFQRALLATQELFRRTYLRAKRVLRIKP